MSLIDKDVRADIILPGVKASHKKNVFQALAVELAPHTAVTAESIAALLSEKEERSASGIGEGIAIPHLKLPGLQQPLAIMARLKNGVDFGAVDGLPVDLVFLLVSPANDGPLHLRRLSRVSRFFRNPELCESLRAAEDADAMRALLIAPEGWLLAA